MASTNQSPAFVVIALFLFAAANPLCHAQVNGLLGGVGGLLNGVTGLVTGVTPVVSGVVTGVTPVVSGVVTGVTPVVPNVVNSVTPVVSGVLGGVTPVVPGVLSGVTPAVPAVVNSVTPAVPAVLNSVTPVVPGVVNGVTPAVPAVVNGLIGLIVNGVLCCTANGNCPAGATALPAGIPISLNCTNLVGGTTTVGQGTVGANGGFSIGVTNVLSTIGGLLNPNAPIPCNVSLPLPLNQAVCNTLSTVTGVLTGAVSTVQSLVSTVNGTIGIVTVPSFSVNASART